MADDRLNNRMATSPNSGVMEIQEILHNIERVTGRFARAAVEAAVLRREEMTPELLGVIEHTVTNAKEIDGEHDSMAHLYAMFLLAQFRESRAYPLLMRFCLLDGELLYSLCGDFITESLGRVLASVSDGELGGIQSIAENEQADEWVRGAALDGLLTLVAEGQTRRESMVHYFVRLFRTKLKRQPSEVWNSLVAASCDIYPIELLDDIRQAYREGLVDLGNINMEDVKHDLALGKDRVLARLASDPHHRMVRNTVKEMEWWACFRRDRKDDVQAPQELSVANHQENLSSAPILMESVSRKIGRNETCPCGSGKKYKKCCLRT